MATPFPLDGRPRVMGIVNVTADSFSDGGRYLDPGRAIEHGLRLRDEGADLVDVGGESTRPGAQPVPVDVVHYSPGFVAYGTPCGEDCDPSRVRLLELEQELDDLRKEVAALKAARQPAPKVKSA